MTVDSSQTVDERDAAAIDAALGETGAAAAAGPSDAHRTRDLLAEVAARVTHRGSGDSTIPPSSAMEQGSRRFVRWLLGAIVIACALLLGVLWWLDPISVTGRQTRFSVVENGGVRQAKLDLMERLAQPPGVLVLGSSRTMKLNPKQIQRTSGVTAFNGGVSGGTTQDIYLYARYADELWGQDGHFPHLVIGVVHDVFRYTGTAALDPRLKRFLPKDAQQRDQLEVAQQLLQLTTLKAAVRAVRLVVPSDGIGALLHPEQGAVHIDGKLALRGKQKGNQLENLDARGMQLFDPVPDDGASLATRIDRQMTTFVKRSYDADPNFTGVDPRGLEMLRRTIRLANARGDVPTLWVTPFAPGAKRYLPKDVYESRDARFRAAIEQLQSEGLRFHFADFADITAFGGNPNDFHDGIHMTEKNTARVIAKLQQLGFLTGADARR